MLGIQDYDHDDPSTQQTEYSMQSEDNQKFDFGTENNSKQHAHMQEEDEDAIIMASSSSSCTLYVALVATGSRYVTSAHNACYNGVPGPESTARVRTS